tara:strand:+ start:1425 stop:2219 length:795 start_codon:yes stop_codon:yes gene_type:complete
MDYIDTTAVIAPAIKTHFWKDLYKSFQNSGAPFHLILVGHIKPNFNLPRNMIWIECSLSAAQCAEIAYRYVYKNLPDVKYIVNIADDLLIPSNFLKDNIQFYEAQKKKLKTEALLVGPICLVQNGMENLMAWKDGGPTLLVTNFTEIKTSKKIGGIDRRFEAIYWDCDRIMRVHEMGGKVVVGSSEQLVPIQEREHVPGLYSKYQKTDKTFLDILWSVTEGIGNLTHCCSLNQQKNRIFEKILLIERKDQTIEYTNEELGKYYE